MRFVDIVSLVQVVAWPVVVLAAVFILRQQLPKLLQVLTGRLTSFTAVGITGQFAAAQPTAETLRVLEQIKEPSSTGPPLRAALSHCSNSLSRRRPIIS